MIHKYVEDYISYDTFLLKRLEVQNLKYLIEIFETLKSMGSRIFIAGNGGSASTASHFVVDLRDRGFNALSLTDNVPLITAISNDYDYEEVFKRQLEGVFKEGDMLIVISASGNSPNLIEAVKYVDSVGGRAIGLLGFDGGELGKLCKLKLIVKTVIGEYGPVEDLHLMLVHLITNYFKKEIGTSKKIVTQEEEEEIVKPSSPMLFEVAKAIDTEPKIAVVIGHRNGYHLVKPCLESLMKTDYPNVDYIIVDDGSIDDSSERLKKEFPNIDLIYTGKDIRYQGAYNTGMRKALKTNAKYIFLAHSDSYGYSKDFFSEVVKEFLTDSEIGMLSTRVENPNGSCYFDGEHVDTFMDIKTNTHSFGPFYTREVLEEIGLFDEEFTCFDDFDMLNRMAKAGYRTSFVPNVTFTHIGGATSNFRREHDWFYNRTKGMFIYLRKHCSNKSYAWREKMLNERIAVGGGISKNANEKEKNEILRGVEDGKRDGKEFYESEGLKWKS